MRWGFLFPGQGAQYVGMGQDLYDATGAARSVFDRANKALGVNLTRLCFEGPEEDLVKTVNAQPAILTHSVAAWTLLDEEGLKPSAVAGHSVGEYSALVAAGALAFEDAVRLVRRRGELMYEAGLRRPGTMSAVVGLTEAVVSEMCERARARGLVQVANLNSPEQIVISGSVEGVEEAERLAAEGGAKRVVRLDVSGAFHSALMEEAADGLGQALSGVEFSAPRVPLVTNVEGKAIVDGRSLRRALERQLTSPVRWVECMRTLIREGCGTFVELGPGRVLSGLMRRIDRGSAVHAVGDVASFEKLAKSLWTTERA